MGIVREDAGSYDRAERDAIRAALGDCAALSVLDAGIWSGSLSPNLVFGGRLTTLQFIPPDCQRGYEISAGTTRTHVRRFPFGDRTFDVAVSSRVLCHIPVADTRSDYLAEVARVLKPSGRFVVTTMHFNFRMRRMGWIKEGWEGGEFFRRYLPDEFRDELEQYFHIERLQGYWIYLPKTYRLYMSLGRWSVYWERALRGLPLSLKYGKFLLGVCRPRVRAVGP